MESRKWTYCHDWDNGPEIYHGEDNVDYDNKLCIEDAVNEHNQLVADRAALLKLLGECVPYIEKALDGLQFAERGHDWDSERKAGKTTRARQTFNFLTRINEQIQKEGVK